MSDFSHLDDTDLDALWQELGLASEPHTEAVPVSSRRGPRPGTSLVIQGQGFSIIRADAPQRGQNIRDAWRRKYALGYTSKAEFKRNFVGPPRPSRRPRNGESKAEFKRNFVGPPGLRGRRRRKFVTPLVEHSPKPRGRPRLGLTEQEYKLRRQQQVREYNLRKKAKKVYTRGPYRKQTRDLESTQWIQRYLKMVPDPDPNLELLYTHAPEVTDTQRVLSDAELVKLAHRFKNLKRN